MRVDLTPQEQQFQLWQSGDYLDLLRGTLTITGTGTARVNSQLEQTYIQFIFEEESGSTYDCSKFFTSANLPNGPALYIRYIGKREDGKLFAEPYALISLVNGSWCHLFPIEKSDLITETERFKSFYTKIVKRAAPLAGGLLGGLMVKSMAGSALRRKDMLLPNWPEVDEIYSSIKRLLHRLAKEAERSGGQSTSEKL